jgi:hypothetical protein
VTHIDPFAPADSPQHPANFGTSEQPTPRQSPATPPSDAAPSWIQIPGEPVPEPSTDKEEREVGRILDARWETYDRLLRAFGTPEQVAYLDADVVTAQWPDDMPTLVNLQEQEGASVGDAETDLAAKLKALEESGM